MDISQVAPSVMSDCLCPCQEARRSTSCAHACFGVALEENISESLLRRTGMGDAPEVSSTCTGCMPGPLNMSLSPFARWVISEKHECMPRTVPS
eukprot:CAMPEP_0183344794 /NCGR_PEP_ID=MMETSP0164_2-20130417/10385_1 /TAXON_ID=221442 /ORGANISM="Coccolithus pelagicus ssp braarudi, Strain PLY182g" /LENGTH=93 /DNA_ID=CAMNT_0025515853 /DNA_START=504 /DNA_END=785 /DNA_ORIENTATION=-